jgi:3',5'-cyclic AMP phosphodiesterase CpdA
VLAFIHMSDVHFSGVLGNTQNGSVSHQDPHSLVLCTTMLAALRNARTFVGMEPSGQFPVVCSGDLTVAGGEEEFRVAQAFLRDTARVSRCRPYDYFGIAATDDWLAAVPGNHDQWESRSGRLNFARGVPAHNPGLAGPQFRPTPWRKEWVASDGSVALELYGVDSTSGHAGAGRLRSKWAAYTQSGSISQAQLKALDALLASSPPKENCARAFVCHHSLAYNSRRMAIQNLEPASKLALQKLAGRHGVHAILTGHTHDFYAGDIGSVGSAAGQTFFELRCASTTATGQGTNGFYLHCLEPRGHAPGWKWTVWTYVCNTHGFVRATAAFARF